VSKTCLHRGYQRPSCHFLFCKYNMYRFTIHSILFFTSLTFTQGRHKTEYICCQRPRYLMPWVIIVLLISHSLKMILHDTMDAFGIPNLEHSWLWKIHNYEGLDYVPIFTMSIKQISFALMHFANGMWIVFLYYFIASKLYVLIITTE